MKNAERMTGAELATMRQACGLSREELARMVDVQSRTIKHWESGSAGVPADVAETVASLLLKVCAAIDRHPHVFAQTMIRYRTDVDMWRHWPELASLPVSVHAAVVAAVMREMASRGGFVRTVWFDAEAYDAWRGDRADSESMRAAWAAEAVASQTLPHRPDQPEPVGIPK